jgi:hypothetical protein
MYIYIYLVGGLEHFLFFHILGIIIPTDFHIFQRGRYTTNQILLIFSWCCAALQKPGLMMAATSGQRGMKVLSGHPPDRGQPWVSRPPPIGWHEWCEPQTTGDCYMVMDQYLL